MHHCEDKKLALIFDSSHIPVNPISSDRNKIRLTLIARKFYFCLRGILSLALIALVLRKLDWTRLGEVLTRVNVGWAVSGWALSALLIAGLALRWRIFLRQQGIALPFTTILSLTWAGQFFNSVMPGSTGGDVVKIYRICQLAPGRKAAAVATIFVDRLTAFLVLAVLAGVAFVINPAPLGVLLTHSLSTRVMAGWLLASLAVVAAAVWLIGRFLRSTHWGGRLARTFAAARNHLSFNRGLLAAVLLAAALHLLNILIAYLFARALGISLTYLQVLLIVPVVAFFVMLPVTINGHGLRELLLIAYFTQMGVALSGRSGNGVREIAIAWSLLLVTNDLLWSMPGGVWYLARFKSTAPISPMPPAALNGS